MSKNEIHQGYTPAQNLNEKCADTWSGVVGHNIFDGPGPVLRGDVLLV